jgi:hypothetical protein
MTPKFRQILYVIGLILFAGLTLLSTFRIIDPNTASSISAVLTTILGLFGVTISGVAGYNVTKQVNKGQFDTASPGDQVITGLDAVIAQAQHAQSEVDRVKTAVTQAVKDIPVLGPLAQQAMDSLPKL